MMTHSAKAAYDVLDHDSYSIAASLKGLSVPRAIYGMTTRSPHPLALHWKRTRIAQRDCVTRTAISCQIQEGSQS